MTKGSLLDKEAINRTTTVYLVHKNIPMLPRSLSENVCSLLPNQDRLAFSCSFRIYLNGALDTSFTPCFYESIINSKAKWSYEIAQQIMEDREKETENIDPGTYNKLKYEDLEEERKPKTEEIFNDMCKQLEYLYKLTKLVRSQRIESGSLIIENDETQFDLNEIFLPIGFKIKKKLAAHNLIEELMLIANKLTAEFIYDHLKELSLVRKHPLLNDSKFQEIQRYLSNNKINVDFEDPVELNKMLFKLKENNRPKFIVILLIYFLVCFS